MKIAAIRTVVAAYRKSLTALAILLVVNIAVQAYRSLIQADQLAALHQSAQQRLTKDYIERSRAESAAAEKALHDLDEWRKSIYGKREFARYVGELLDLIAAKKLAVGGITYKPAVTDSNRLLTYQIKVNVSGKYQDVKTLLGDLQRLRNPTIVNDVTLDNPSQTEESIQLNLVLTTYFRSEEQ